MVNDNEIPMIPVETESDTNRQENVRNSLFCRVHQERNVLHSKYIKMFRPFLDLLGALLPTQISVTLIA
jgi:hypothetical protein